jgi:hypothetical protein
MTGEMCWKDLESYPDMLALAKKIQSGAKVAAEVRPFDVYQGPFVAVNLNSGPLRGKGTNKIGSWQISIWYDDEWPGRFTLKYRNKHSKHNTSGNIVNIIKSYIDDPREDKSKAIGKYGATIRKTTVRKTQRKRTIGFCGKRGK